MVVLWILSIPFSAQCSSLLTQNRNNWENEENPQAETTISLLDLLRRQIIFHKMNILPHFTPQRTSLNWKKKLKLTLLSYPTQWLPPLNKSSNLFATNEHGFPSLSPQLAPFSPRTVPPGELPLWAHAKLFSAVYRNGDPRWCQVD